MGSDLRFSDGMRPEVRFAIDSALEETGFEPLVPKQPDYLSPPGYEPRTDLNYPPYSGSPSYEYPRESGEATLPPSPGYEYQSPPAYPPVPTS